MLRPSRQPPLIALLAFALLLIVDLQLGYYGLYVQWGIAPARTLLVPAIECLVIFVVLLAACARFQSTWPSLGSAAKFTVCLAVMLLVFIPVAIERTHASFMADIDSQIVAAVQSGHSARVPAVRYVTPLTSTALSARHCELIGMGPLEFTLTRDAHIVCATQHLSARVTYLWSSARIAVLPW